MRVPLQWLLSPPAPLRRLVILLAAQQTLRPVLRRRSPVKSISEKHKKEAVVALRKLVPPLPSHMLGGERIDANYYMRFLSVCEWEAETAASILERDFQWRRKYKPRLLRPSDMPIMCRQNAWQVMMRGGNKGSSRRGQGSSSVAESSSSSSGGGGGGGGSSNGGISSGGGAPVTTDLVSGLRGNRPPLQPPHTKPPLQQWRYTRQGMPLTFLEVNNWKPECASHEERVRHVAYHMVRTRCCALSACICGALCACICGLLIVRLRSPPPPLSFVPSVAGALHSPHACARGRHSPHPALLHHPRPSRL